MPDLRRGWTGLVAGGAALVLAMCGIGLSAGAATTSTVAPGTETPQLVYDGDFPDPSVLFADGVYYAYSTNVDGENLPVMRSSDLVHWQHLGDAMAFLPTWAADLTGFTWAPSVAGGPGGGYEAFFSTLDTNGEECIGRATAPTPTGPFLDTSSGPLVCPDGAGAIDPFLYHTGSGDYLVWKADTGKGKPGEIWAQRLSESDAALTGVPTLLLTADKAWEGGIVEGPDLAEIAGQLSLLFSANRWDTKDYAIGITTCASPLGPCDAANAHELVGSQSSMEGPGGPDVIEARGQPSLVFSAWTGGQPGSSGSHRSLFLSPFDLGDAAPTKESTASNGAVADAIRHVHRSLAPGAERGRSVGGVSATRRWPGTPGRPSTWSSPRPRVRGAQSRRSAPRQAGCRRP